MKLPLILLAFFLIANAFTTAVLQFPKLGKFLIVFLVVARRLRLDSAALTQLF